MRVHHLNCGTLCPAGGFGGLVAPERIVCHCLLVETRDGLVLVATGLGLADVRDVGGRLTRGFRTLLRPRLVEDECAIRQVVRLGFEPRDVRHIVITHLDSDHAGGLADLPWAKVHVHALEHEAVMAQRSAVERLRYLPAQWRHGPDWQLHGAAGAGGDRWFGFHSVRALPGEEILLVPLQGHTRGHAGVALKVGDGWILHAGDAYFHHGEMEPSPRCPLGLALVQRTFAFDNEARLRNQARLRTLVASPSSGVTVLCAHDPVYLERFRGGGGEPDAQVA